MSTQVLMPALSPTMEEGTLAKWLVHEGQEVKAGDVIAEIETDKATMEVEAVDEGRLEKILVPAGTENVKVNTPIAVIAGKDDATAPAKPAKAESLAPPRSWRSHASHGRRRRMRRVRGSARLLWEPPHPDPLPDGEREQSERIRTGLPQSPRETKTASPLAQPSAPRRSSRTSPRSRPAPRWSR